MQELFTQLTRAVESTWLTAVAASFIWGILSILLSPCHLASIPLIVGFIDQQGRISTKRAFWISFLFAAGILITIGAIGAITAAAGRMMGDVGKYGNYFVAAIFFLVGLHLLDVIPMPWSGPGRVGFKRKGMLAAFILGLVFGIALGPCTFAFMAPMLGVTVKGASTNPRRPRPARRPLPDFHRRLRISRLSSVFAGIPNSIWYHIGRFERLCIVKRVKI